VNNFDINKVDIWATYIHSRRPHFKIHYKKGHATSALKCSRVRANPKSGFSYEISDECKLWQLVDGKWQEVEFERFYN
jgi:hypothetical protein